MSQPKYKSGNYAKSVQTHLASPMLPVYDRMEANFSHLDRRSCAHEMGCLNYIAKVHPNCIKAVCPEACSQYRAPNIASIIYDATRAKP